MTNNNVKYFSLLKSVNTQLMLLITATALCISSADANEDGTGPYVGLGLGSTAYVDSGFVEEQQTKQEQLGALSSGYKLYAGYLFNPVIGLEASYVDYGEFTAGSYTHASKSLNISANLGYTFLEGQLRPFALLGFGYLFNSFPHDNTPLIDQDSYAFHLGFGVDYTPKGLGGVGFRLAYEGNSFAYDTDANLSTTADSYQQVFGILYLGVHYKF